VRQCVSSHRAVAVVKKVEMGGEICPSSTKRRREDSRLDHVQITKKGSTKNINFGHYLLTDIITDE